MGDADVVLDVDDDAAFLGDVDLDFHWAFEPRHALSESDLQTCFQSHLPYGRDPEVNLLGDIREFTSMPTTRGRARFSLEQTDTEDTAFDDAFGSVSFKELYVEVSPAQLPCVVKALQSNRVERLECLQVNLRQDPRISLSTLLANVVDSVSHRRGLSRLVVRILDTPPNALAKKTPELAHEAAADPSPESSPIDLSAALVSFFQQPDRELDFHFRLDPATASSLARALEQATQPIRLLRLEVVFSTHNDLFTALQKAPIQNLSLDVPETKGVSGPSDHLTALVSNNSTLRELVLQGEGVDDSHVAGIASGLHKTTLTELRLHSSNVTDEGATAIAAALPYNATLRSLNMIGCSVVNLGTEWLATERLEYAHPGIDVRWPPRSLRRKGTYAFLRELQEDSPPLSVQRVNLVGDGGVGKTTFKTALLMRKARSSAPLEALRKVICERVRLWTDGHVKTWVQELAERSTTDHVLANQYVQGLKLGGFNGKRLLTLGSTQDVQGRLSGEDLIGDEVVERVCEVLHFINPDFKVKSGSTGLGGKAKAGVDYSALTSLPHVWTEGAVPDSWGDHAIWDFPGQMQYYPAHHVFLGCETAVYVVVVDGSADDSEACTKNALHWLGLIRSGAHRTEVAVSVRIVITHTDKLSDLARDALLRAVHAELCDTVRVKKFFELGERCFATLYERPNGGDLEGVHDELYSLLGSQIQNRRVPTRIQKLVSTAVNLAKKNPTWPIVPVADLIVPVAEQGGPKALDDVARICLHDLGIIRVIDGGRVILQPVKWLSNVFAALLDPQNGLGASVERRRSQQTYDDLTRHMESVLVTEKEARRIVNLGRHTPLPKTETILALVAQFDMCFECSGGYLFPALDTLPSVDKGLPDWLKPSFDAALNVVQSGRRYTCCSDTDVLPPMLFPMLMAVANKVGQDVGATSTFFGRGVGIWCLPAADVNHSYCVVQLSPLTDGTNGLDVFGVGRLHTAFLCTIVAQLASILGKEFYHVQVTVCALTALKPDQRGDLLNPPEQHALLGPCRSEKVQDGMRCGQIAIYPPWLDELCATIAQLRDWSWNNSSTLSVLDDILSLLSDTIPHLELVADKDSDPGEASSGVGVAAAAPESHLETATPEKGNRAHEDPDEDDNDDLL